MGWVSGTGSKEDELREAGCPTAWGAAAMLQANKREIAALFKLDGDNIVVDHQASLRY